MVEAKVLIFGTDSIEPAYQIRRTVFQQEQKILEELDFDGNDRLAAHIIAYKDGIPVGTARTRFKNPDTWSIERVAVLSNMRGRGIGRLIIKTAEDYLTSKGVRQTSLDSQLDVKDFYSAQGYRQDGVVFEETGIPHVKMVKHFK